MVDSIEIKLDQLTQAIKGLYAKSSSTQGDIYNALTNLFSRYENAANLSNEKLASILVNEFRKTFDFKYEQMNQYVKNLEDNLKNFMAVSQNPNTAAEITKILNDTSNIYSKLNSCEFNIDKVIEQTRDIKNSKDSSEIVKLSENFIAFSRGFDGVINTLNKNFADFFNQLKQTTTKEDLQGIVDSLNSFIFVAENISGEFKDLASIIEIVNSSNVSIEDIKNSIISAVNSTNELKDKVDVAITNTNDIKEKADITITNTNELKGNLENIASSINEIKNNISEKENNGETEQNTVQITGKIDELKREVSEFSSDIADVKNTISDVLYGMDNTKNTIEQIKGTVNNLNSGNFDDIREDFSKISLDIKDTNSKIADLKNTLSSDKKQDIDSVITDISEMNLKVDDIKHGFSVFSNDVKDVKDELGSISLDISDIKSNIKKDASVQNLEIKDNISELSLDIVSIKEEINKLIDSVKVAKFSESINPNDAELVQKINTSAIDTKEIITQIEKVLKESLKDVNTSKDLSIISTLREDVQKLFESTTASRNYMSKLADLIRNDEKLDTTSLSENLKANNDVLNEALKVDLDDLYKKIAQDKIKENENLKLDLQKLSDRISENLDDENNKTKRELAAIKYRLREFGMKQNDDVEKIADKLATLENGLENFMLNLSDNSVQKEAMQELREKLADKISEISTGSREALAQVNAKIDKANLQQIHNSKELLEEIQTFSSDVINKIASFEKQEKTDDKEDDLKSVLEPLSQISNEIQSQKQELLNQKAEMEQKFKETVQKIGALILKKESILKTEDKSATNLDNLVDNITDKFREYISNFEILRGDITQEIQDNINNGLVKMQEQVKKAIVDANDTYDYTMDDIESDLAKIRLSIEKNIATISSVETLENKVLELRSHIIDNSKADKENKELLSDIIEKIEDIQLNGFEEIKTRILQSEKSKTNTEHEARVEKALSAIINNSKNQNEKIVELKNKVEMFVQSQAEAFNPSQFIDIFYDNMTQTKMLANRVEIMEDKITSIQNAVEKLVSYVEQP